MFGSNAIESKDRGDGQILRVNEVFRTLQGEGPLVGTPSVFLRLAGCNLACTFCDTEFERSEDLTLRTIETAVATIAGDSIKLVVLTGGEPMLQQITPLIAKLLFMGMSIQIETAGTVWPDDLAGFMSFSKFLEVHADRLTLVCSPKTPKIHPKVIDHCRHYKYIVAEDDRSAFDDLPVNSTQRSLTIKTPVWRPEPIEGRTDPTIWVQPKAEYRRYGSNPPTPDAERTNRNMLHAANIAMQRGYRLSLQTHKILGLP